MGKLENLRAYPNLRLPKISFTLLCEAVEPAPVAQVAKSKITTKFL